MSDWGYRGSKMWEDQNNDQKFNAWYPNKMGGFYQIQYPSVGYYYLTNWIMFAIKWLIIGAFYALGWSLYFSYHLFIGALALITDGMLRLFGREPLDRECYGKFWNSFSKTTDNPQQIRVDHSDFDNNPYANPSSTKEERNRWFYGDCYDEFCGPGAETLNFEEPIEEEIKPPKQPPQDPDVMPML